ncbi:unnamed protein product [Urochloa decumbens]|uniref:Uncharacterized protein n=1 Tax=Urochloa decumbens TaxID=240449 RepID=A0ABC9E1Q1_9POAL
MRNMHPLLRTVARRAALAATRRRGDTRAIQPEVRAHMRAPEEIVQFRPRSGLELFTIGWTSVMFGVLAAHIVRKFKPPPKTIEEMWLEAHAQKQGSEVNIGSCSCQGGDTSS